MTDLAWLTVAEAAELLRAKKLSPVEYTRALIDRIEKHDSKLNAFLRFTPDIALDDARRAEAEIARGEWRGPFHGVPYGLKDIVDYAGLPTTAHSKILKDNVAGSRCRGDAEAARRGRRVHGQALDPRVRDRRSVLRPAVAARAQSLEPRSLHAAARRAARAPRPPRASLPAAIGTDTGGSMRNPASMCGVVGMKPTYGLVSRRGVMPLAFSLDHVGPLTRTVRDNALMLDLIAGYDPLDPGSVESRDRRLHRRARARRQGPAHRRHPPLLHARHAGRRRRWRRASRPR